MVLAANPVAGYGGVLAGSLAQQAVQRFQSGPSDGRLPGAIPPALGELVEDTPRLGERVLRALRDEEHVHAACFPVSVAMAFKVSIM